MERLMSDSVGDSAEFGRRPQKWLSQRVAVARALACMVERCDPAHVAGGMVLGRRRSVLEPHEILEITAYDLGPKAKRALRRRRRRQSC